MPLFLDQLAETLQRPSSRDGGGQQRGAAVHGAALLHRGYTVAQVVHDYGDICQAITELAEEVDAPITTDEFHTLNMCLDNAIAEAVTEYTRLREHSMAEGETERLGVFAHELRNAISAAQLAFAAIQSGRAPTGGSVAAVVGRSLQRNGGAHRPSPGRGASGLRERCSGSASICTSSSRTPRSTGTMEARLTACRSSVSAVDRGIDVDVDPQILAGAMANLLQNAFKFTHAGGHVALRATVSRARVEIEIEDECGGLPPGKSGGDFRRLPAAGHGPEWPRSRSLHQPQGRRGERRRDSRA